MRGIGCQKLCREVVRALEHEVAALDMPQRVAWQQSRFYNFDAHVMTAALGFVVECGGSTIDFFATDLAFGIEDLSVQVAEVDDIVLQNRERSNAALCQ